MQIVNIHKQTECSGLVSSIVVYKSAVMDRRTTILYIFLHNISENECNEAFYSFQKERFIDVLILVYMLLLLPPPGGYVITCGCFFVSLFVCLSICLFVCRQYISKSIAPIYMKICGKVGRMSTPLNCG